MFFEVLLWVFDFEDHDGEELGVQSRFWVVLALFFLCSDSIALLV